MIQLHENSIYLVDGRPEEKASIPQNEARKQTMAWQILQAHNTSGDPERLKIRFDAMVSHDITYVGIIQQARASGMKEFPIPYALTNCHNSLCAVGGTINPFLFSCFLDFPNTPSKTPLFPYPSIGD